MKSLALRIEGMHCSGCAHTIEALLGCEPGLKSARVSHSNGTGRFLFDPSVTDADRIVSIIEQAGYKVQNNTESGGQ